MNHSIAGSERNSVLSFVPFRDRLGCGAHALRGGGIPRRSIHTDRHSRRRGGGVCVFAISFCPPPSQSDALPIL